MQTQNYPLIFVVEDNSGYNKIIANHLISNKFKRIESFFSSSECVKNLYKKPDIVIQDYLINELIGKDIHHESKKNNVKTEFVYLSGLDNFSKERNQNARFVALSESDNFDVSTDTIKFGPHDYVVKDLVALEKLIVKIGKKQQVRHFMKQVKASFSLLIVTLASLLLSRSVGQ